jgi:hypothetical protein
VLADMLHDILDSKWLKTTARSVSKTSSALVSVANMKTGLPVQQTIPYPSL